MESVNQLKNFRFIFSKLWYGPFGFNQKNVANFDKFNNWNLIRSMKFEAVQILFLVNFRFVVIQKFFFQDNVT